MQKMGRQCFYADSKVHTVQCLQNKRRKCANSYIWICTSTLVPNTWQVFTSGKYLSSTPVLRRILKKNSGSDFIIKKVEIIKTESRLNTRHF